MLVDAARVKLEFGNRLRAFRTAADLSQERLAERAGLHRTYVSSAERGERNVSLVNLHRLAGALGVRAAELLSADLPADGDRED